MQVKFHFESGNSNAYLCHRVIPEIEVRTGVSLQGIKNKGECAELETQRFLVGAFGSSTLFVDGDIYFGKDSLPALEERIFERLA